MKDKLTRMLVAACLALCLLVFTMALHAGDRPQQIVTLVYEAGSSADGSRTATVYYDAIDGARTPGLGFRLHFDSSRVEIIEVENHLEDSSLGMQILTDDSDFDADPSTDRYLNAAWVELLGQWPEDVELPVALYTITFDTQSRSGNDLFSITEIESAAGFEFVANIR